MIKRYNNKELDKLAEILKNEGVISIPTDTVYGICASINSKKAYNKMLEIKNRPISKSFPVMCANKEEIAKIANVNKVADIIISSFMPGPITIVLPKKNNLPNYITNGKDTIAIRIAPSKDIQQLIIKTGNPLFMTSANQSGQPVCKTLEEIELSCPSLDGMLEGQPIYAESSTIIDCTTNNIKILREGPITLEDINKIINKSN